MQRALIERSEGIENLPDGFRCFKPTIIQSNFDFKDSKSKKQNDAKLNACPTCTKFLKYEILKSLSYVNFSNLLVGS